MNNIKGFSLIEVLVSLMLVATLALMLFDLQAKNRYLMVRWVLQAKASHILDRINEGLYEPFAPVLHIPESYDLNIQRNNKMLIVRLEWPDKSGEMTRIVRSMG